MTDKGLGQEVDRLYATIDTFITEYNALKKKWDAASILPLLPIEEAFQENCSLAAFVGTKDPEANDAISAEERNSVSAVLARGGNPYKELFRLFQKHAGAVLHKAEADQKRQLTEYLRKAGGNDQSYELAQKHATSAAQEVESCEARIKSLKEEKRNLEDKLDPDVGLPDFFDGWGDEYAGAAEAGWSTGVNWKISRVDGDISSEQAKLPNLRTTATNLQNQVGDIKKEKGIREKAIATLKASDAHLTAIQERLQDISNKSVKDVVKFDTKTRARLGNKVVAFVNQGAYFADRPKVLLILRRTLTVVRKANDLTGSSEDQVRLLKENADLVSKLLDQSQAAITAGKHESDLPQPAKLLEAE
ncbi:hypothetical protein FGADI_12119 [Fusarium gaditjirri]|uniref:Uncharacterized protein n=1 Tax=Fusarium gaditjirri TaxID=282569 RepID=A0A8H4STE7_9HYPO|nr:hypothetical protein FGADI_12119 [Fusarium gaditjirri]